MELDESLQGIQESISKGEYDIAGERIRVLDSMSSDSPRMRLVCISLFKVVGLEDDARKVSSSLSKMESPLDQMIEVSRELRNSGYPNDALAILARVPRTDEASSAAMGCLLDAGMYKECLVESQRKDLLDVQDVLNMAISNSFLGNHENAIDGIVPLIDAVPIDMDAEKAYCTIMANARRTKELEKRIRSLIKKDDGNGDGNALMAYLLWLDGRMVGVGAYSMKALKGNPKNILALEMMAYFLLEKGKVNEAKMMAASINQVSSGHQASFRILNACNLGR